LKTILAGYPWFTDWGRDTMIAFEGLVLCTKRFKEGREILESFSKYINNGLIPNLFPDENTEPLYNTVDASLWYFQAVYAYLKHTNTEEDYKFIEEVIYEKLVEIFKAYSRGTLFSIGMDMDGLIYSGSGLDQVTWMDVRVGDLVVTPRHGKAVEINALWYNALCIMEELRIKFNKEDLGYLELSYKVKESFNKKFWNEEKKSLYDVIDELDDKIRPNQLLAISLPFSVLEKNKEKIIVDTAFKHLYSTYGMKSLSFLDKEFKDKYIGKLIDRDKAYHMGTTWAYLIGPFISAYCKAYDYSKEVLENSKKMLELFEDHLKDGCINGIAEIFDGEYSSVGRGCFSQAWSIGEVLRAYIEVYNKLFFN
jgi:predicted glycogen debranching enzyme